MNSNKSLHEYKNHAVIVRYCKDFNKTLEFGEEVFTQLLKWLDISTKFSFLGSTAFMTNEIIQIDNIWHTFILFTRDYEAFCHKYFNCFIHHAPADSETPFKDREEKKIFFRAYLTFIEKELGKETLISWFKEKKYA